MGRSQREENNDLNVPVERDTWLRRNVNYARDQDNRQDETTIMYLFTY